jgi:hypothetical protein
LWPIRNKVELFCFGDLIQKITGLVWNEDVNQLGSWSFGFQRRVPTKCVAKTNVGSFLKGSSMRILLPIALAFCVFGIISFTESTAHAQDAYSNGYGFGAGLNFGRNFDRPGYGGRYGFGYGLRGPLADFGRFGLRERLEEPPYFAKYPPVYYSHIVYRPYGVSPYAAPPGIVPVEMNAPAPVSISNPYFDQEVAPVSSETRESVEQVEANDDVTCVRNPYIDSIVNN